MKVYNPGDKVDLKNGGIMFRGGLSKQDPHQEMEEKMAKMQGSAHNNSLKGQALKVIEKKIAIQKLGEMAKSMNLVQNIEEGEFHGI